MGFLIKLWRGEVSLGTTFWIFGALVVFMFQVLEMVPMEDPAGSKILTFISSAYYVFIAIAIFRSSFRHTGSRMLIFYAQLSAVGLLVLVAMRIFLPEDLFGGLLP